MGCVRGERQGQPERDQQDRPRRVPRTSSATPDVPGSVTTDSVICRDNAEVGAFEQHARVRTRSQLNVDTDQMRSRQERHMTTRMRVLIAAALLGLHRWMRHQAEHRGHRWQHVRDCEQHAGDSGIDGRDQHPRAGAAGRRAAARADGSRWRRSTRRLKGVAALREPMGSVAALDPSMRSLAALGTPMTQLVAIRPGLEATAALGPSMDRLAACVPASKPSRGCRLARARRRPGSAAVVRGGASQPMDQLEPAAEADGAPRRARRADDSRG